MGFFKKLKARILTLNIDEKTSTSQTKATKPSQQPPPSTASSDQRLQKEIAKEQKKLRKEQFKRQKKAQKIDKYVAGLKKSGSSFAQRMKELQARHHQIDDDLFEELEELLIMSDISVPLVMDLIDAIKKTVQIEQVQDPRLIAEIVADKMFAVYANQSVVDTTLNVDHQGVNVILVVGVNGSGKTTSIAKLAHMLKNEGKKVLIAAGDTFRAGAVAQLVVWANRIGVEIVKSDRDHADPAAVVFEAVQKAQEEHYDVLIIDTAGRLQNKVNLMNELAKINKIVAQKIPGAPHESLLVLDATTGQNGVSQALHFKDVTPLSGIILTKMDGTSKGGIVLTIKDQLDLAVKFIGLGEQLEDLQEFDLDAFIYGMTKDLME